MALELILIGLILVIIIAFVVIYNGLIVKKNRAENAWAQIDVQLKRRADLVPNLVATVKGYASHEKTVFEEVTKARSALVNANSVAEKAQASNLLTGALKSLFAVAENYPDLKASTNFLQLQEELSGIEAKIASTRQFYNDAVLEFNNTIQTIPSKIIAALFRFKEMEYFEIEEEAKKVPKISF